MPVHGKYGVRAVAVSLSPERRDCMVSSDDDIVLSEAACQFLLLAMKNIGCQRSLL